MTLYLMSDKELARLGAARSDELATGGFDGQRSDGMERGQVRCLAKAIRMNALPPSSQEGAANRQMPAGINRQAGWLRLR